MPNAAELWKSASPASKISLLVKLIDTKLQKVRFYTVITRTFYPLCFQYTLTLYKRLPANIMYMCLEKREDKMCAVGLII